MNIVRNDRVYLGAGLHRQAGFKIKAGTICPGVIGVYLWLGRPWLQFRLVWKGLDRWRG